MFAQIVRPLRWLLLGALLGTVPLAGQGFQFMIERDEPTPPQNERMVRLYLWLPPEVPLEDFRGFIFAKRNLAEAAFVRDPTIREFCAEAGLAIIYFDPSPFGIELIDEWGQDVQFENLVKLVTMRAGVPRIGELPFFAFGHSASAPFMYHLGYRFGPRMLGIIYYKSGNIGTFEPEWGDQYTGISNVPMLAINGELEEFGPEGQLAPNESLRAQYLAVRDDLKALRGLRRPVQQVILQGEGHYTWSTTVAPYVVAFMRAAMAARLPAEFPAEGPVRLQAPEGEAGWLTDTRACFEDGVTLEDRHEPAPFDDFAGEPTEAWWHASEELARAWEELHTTGCDRLEQAVTYGSGLSPQQAPAVALPDQFFQPLSQSIVLSAQSSAGLPVFFEVLRGSTVRISENQFQINPARPEPGLGGMPAMFLAYQPGTEAVAPAERVASYVYPYVTQGADNVVTFPMPEPSAPGRWELTATASAGLPVSYRVLSGPVRRVGNQLVYHEVPVATDRDSFEVRLVAGQEGQIGLAGQPGVKTAAPVHRTFTIPAPGVTEDAAEPGPEEPGPEPTED